MRETVVRKKVTLFPSPLLFFFFFFFLGGGRGADEALSELKSRRLKLTIIIHRNKVLFAKPTELFTLISFCNQAETAMRLRNFCGQAQRVMHLDKLLWPSRELCTLTSFCIQTRQLCSVIILCGQGHRAMRRDKLLWPSTKSYTL